MKTKIVTIWNVKGGVGKTTCTFNLAAELSRRGKRVLCVDLDFQGNLSSFWDDEIIKNPGKKDILDVLEEQVEIFDNSYTAKSMGVDLIRAPRAPRTPRNLSQDAIRKVLAKSKNYDLVFIDTHPSAGILEKSALFAADYVLIPIYLDKFSRDNLNLAVDTLAEIGVKKVGVFANRLRNQRVQRMVLDDLISRHDYPILENCISDRTAIPSAARLGKPVYAHRSKSPAATDFSDLADEIISKLQEGK